MAYASLMSDPVNVYDAETHFSKLLERVALGEEVVIARNGTPIAKLSPLASKHDREPGGAEGLVVPDDFFEPLPEDVMRHFE